MQKEMLFLGGEIRRKGVGFLTRKEQDNIQTKNTRTHEIRLQQFCCVFCFCKKQGSQAGLSSVME